MRCLPACLVLLASAATAAQVNVRDHGAVGDGVAKDTKAIQQAIDVCAEGGGGRVVLPRGRYLSGSLVLRDGVTLVVEPEAVLLGSRELADFSGPLLGAKDARNIGIEGGGTIDGQGEAYWEKARDYAGPAWKGTAQFEYKALRRPAFIRLVDCSDITVRNVKLVGAPSWTLHLHRCQRAVIEDVVIRNPLYGPNTDGIDLNACTDIAVRRCDIVTGDDGIVLKSTGPGRDHPSRNILVEDCRIWSACNGFKIGTETHADFSDITVRNCHIYSDSERNLDRTISGIAIESVDGSHIRRVQVSDITMSGVRAPIFIRLGHRGGNSERTRQVEPRVPGSIEEVVIQRVKAERASITSSITGIPGHPVRNILLEDIELTYEGGGDASQVIDDVPDETVIRTYPEAWMFGILPAYGLYCRHAENVVIRRVVMGWTAPEARPMVVADQVRGVVFDQVDAVRAPAAHPVYWLTRSREVQIRNSTAPAGTGVFVVHEGTAADGVVLADCDTRAAATALAVLPPGGLLNAGLPLVSETSPGLVLVEPAKMRLHRPMQAVGEAVEVPIGQGRDVGSARCRFTVAEAGDYVVWVRVFAPSGESDSFHLSLGDQPFSLSDVSRTGEWLWDAVRDRRDGKPDFAGRTVFPLAAGEHLLRLRNRESGTRIERIAIVREGVVFPPGE